jgi:hypothetical protein
MVNYLRAYRFGKLALSLLDRIKSRDAECSTTGLTLTWLTHWYDPVRDMPDILRRAASTGFEVGDMVYGTYCLNASYRIEIALGTNLDDLEDAMRSSYQKIRDLSRDGMDIWSQTAIQFVLNLRCRDVSNWQDLLVLTGEIMDEVTYMRKAITAKHNLLVLLAWSYKAQLACLFGFWSISENLYEDIRGIGQSFQYSFGRYTAFIVCWDCIIFTVCAKQETKTSEACKKATSEYCNALYLEDVQTVVLSYPCLMRKICQFENRRRPRMSLQRTHVPLM